MSATGEKLIKAAHEAVAVAKGEIPAARITIGGHTYVPVSQIDKVYDCLGQALRQWKMYAEYEEDRDLATEQSAEGELYRELLTAKGA